MSETTNHNILVDAAQSVENADALDPAITTVRAVVGRVLRPGPLRDVLRGGPLGHPAHPLAVLVPTGAWVSAVALDFAPGYQKASRTLVGVGLLAAGPTALAGIADWSALEQKSQQRVGIVHWAANLTAVLVFLASYVQRRRGKQFSGRVLSLLGLSLVSVGGYLGGHLAYRQAANVSTD